MTDLGTGDYRPLTAITSHPRKPVRYLLTQQHRQTIQNQPPKPHRDPNRLQRLQRRQRKTPHRPGITQRQTVHDRNPHHQTIRNQPRHRQHHNNNHNPTCSTPPTMMKPHPADSPPHGTILYTTGADTNTLYTLDTTTGTATPVSVLTSPNTTEANPQGHHQQNRRIHHQPHHRPNQLHRPHRHRKHPIHPHRTSQRPPNHQRQRHQPRHRRHQHRSQ